MCAICNSIIFTESAAKKKTWFLLEKIRAVFQMKLKSEYKKPWSKRDVIIFETNIFIEMVICMAVDCKSDSRQEKT